YGTIRPPALTNTRRAFGASHGGRVLRRRAAACLRQRRHLDPGVGRGVRRTVDHAGWARGPDRSGHVRGERSRDRLDFSRGPNDSLLAGSDTGGSGTDALLLDRTGRLLSRFPARGSRGNRARAGPTIGTKQRPRILRAGQAVSSPRPPGRSGVG